MNRILVSLVLTCLFASACAASKPNLEATVQAAISLTQTASPPQQLPTSASAKPITSASPPATPRTSLLPATSPPPTRMQGVVLFASETLSDTQVISRSLYSLVGQQVKVAASNWYRESSLSPDKEVVANYPAPYESECDGCFQILAVNAREDTLNPTTYRLPDMYDRPSQRDIQEIIWSPNGTQLVVRTTCSLYVFTVATGRFVEIINQCYNVNFIEGGPDNVEWSPDSSRLAFDILNEIALPTLLDELHGGRPAKLVVASADGATTQVLDESGAHPTWSPDGQQILYEGGLREEKDGHVFCNESVQLIRADGSNRTTLAGKAGATDDSHYDYYDFGWPLDGSRLWFLRSRSNLSTVRPDGTAKVDLSAGSVVEACYLPQSKSLAWREDQKDSGVFVGGLDGSDKMKLDADVGVATVSLSPCGATWPSSKEWRTVSFDGKHELRFPAEPSFSSDCANALFTKDGGIYISDDSGYWSVVIDKIPGDRIEFVAWIP
jgi:hypothetical protein